MIHHTTKRSKVRVGVVRGGQSHEYDVSLKTGAAVLKALPDMYHGRDIFIDKNGVWHLDGVEKRPEQIIRHIDVLFNALHGQFGEDGKIQKFLDTHGVKYTGSGALASAIAMNKFLTKKHALLQGIKTPLHTTVQRDEDVHARAIHIFKTFPHPAIVKPVSAGSSVGVSLATTLATLTEAIKNALIVSDVALIEECITGKEATCGVIDDFRGEGVYTLPPVEIVHSKKLFDYDAKYGGKTREICPGNFTEKEKAEIQRVAALVHKTLNLRHYSRSDFIVNPRRGVYFLEVNTLPGLTNESLLPKSLEAVGSSLGQFLHHVIDLALHKK